MKQKSLNRIPYPARLTTKRLRICSAAPGDARILNRAVKESFPELNRWLPWAKKMPAFAETEVFARKSAALFMQRQDYSFRIFLPEGRKFVGCIGLHSRDPEVPAFEIGYWLHSSHTGKGYMTEAVASLVSWGREVVGAKRILIRAQTRNRASWSIPQRLGFKFEGIHRNQIRDNAGKLAHMRMYALTFDD
jgi:ribosomal-protein-serine acetyltransferase